MLLREKCSYSKFFWSVFSPNVGKYQPGKLRIRTLFTQCVLVTLLLTLEKFMFVESILKTLSNSSAWTIMISSRKYSFFISITFFTSRSTRYFTLIKWLCKALNKWIVPARPTPHIAMTTCFVELKIKKTVKQSFCLKKCF